jgi:hypothetical protein
MTQEKPLPIGPLVAGWLLPGGGHFLLGRKGRGALLMGAIALLFVFGMLNQGRFFEPARGNWIDSAGFLGNLCAGLFYFGAKLAGYAAPITGSPHSDYGSKFLLIAGLLNVLAILDAYDIAVGKKD